MCVFFCFLFCTLLYVSVTPVGDTAGIYCLLSPVFSFAGDRIPLNTIESFVKLVIRSVERPSHLYFLSNALRPPLYGETFALSTYLSFQK